MLNFMWRILKITNAFFLFKPIDPWNFILRILHEMNEARLQYCVEQTDCSVVKEQIFIF